MHNSNRIWLLSDLVDDINESSNFDVSKLCNANFVNVSHAVVKYSY